MRLFIIMRNDMDSLNPGKACAQAAHAANQAVNYLKEFHLNLYNEWNTAIHFGTTIVLEGSLEDILEEAENRDRKGIIFTGLTRDPTYPVKDGSVTHEIDIATCAWFWVNDPKYIFKYAGLMK